MRQIISKTDLKVGQWVCFSATAKDLAEASKEEQKIYKENNFFLVISRKMQCLIDVDVTLLIWMASVWIITLGCMNWDMFHESGMMKLLF